MDEPASPASQNLQVLRVVHAFTKFALMGVLACCVAASARHMVIYMQLEMKELPLLTELTLVVSNYAREWYLPVALVGVLLVVLGLTGALDMMLIPMIGLDVVLIVFLLIGWLIGLQLPLRKIQTILGS